MHAQGDFNESYGYGYACKPSSRLGSPLSRTSPFWSLTRIKMA